jgi:hypothetical protein
MNEGCSSELSVDFHRTTRRYIPENIYVFITTAVRTSDPTKEASFDAILKA